MAESPHAVAPDPARMWYVTVTLAGDPVGEAAIRAALERLSAERPFLMAGRYAADRAEVRYWEEAECLEDAAALALRLWGEHRTSAGLPRWEVVALEVLERDVFHLRGIAGELDVRLARAGRLRPF